MAEDVKKKVRIKNGHKLVVKNTIKKTRDLLTPPGTNVDEETTIKLKSFQTTIQKKQEDIKNLNNEILELLTENEDIEKFIVENAELDEEIEEIVCQIDRLLKRQATPAPLQGRHRSEESPAQKVKLPKLSLTSFNGDPTQWISFWDSFKSSINENNLLANVEKMKYLQNSLSGDAAETIAGLPITNENYVEALELLEKRFGNKQIIISRHIENLMDLPRISSIEHIRKLRTLYDKAEATVRSLRGIGIYTHSYGTVLSPIIMSKIPQDLRIILGRKLPDSWELDELLGVFGEELNLREKCAFAPISGPSTTNTQEQKFRNFKTPATQGYHSTTSTLVSNVYPTQDRERNVPNCLFCSKKHFSASCATVTDPTTRKNILREKKRCFVCLRSGHLSRNCHSAGKCFHCGGSHHAAICSSNSVRKHQREVFSSETSRGATAPRVNTTEHVSTLYLSQDPTKNSVLLQTAQASVFSVDNEINTRKIRLILDTGSQKTYITKSLRDSLQLPTIKTENVLIKEFGNQQGTLKECDVVQLAVRGDDNLTVYIYAYVVEVICSPLSSQVIQFAQEYYPHLRNLKLADQNTGLEDTEINLLIGADFFWSFMLDSVVRGEYGFGPVATLTRFGYVLSGPVPVHNSNTFSSNITISHVLKVETVSSGVNEELKQGLHKFWDYETLGIKENSSDSQIENGLLDNKIKFIDGRYQVSIPFKADHPTIPDNFQVSKRRLNSLVNRLNKSPETLSQYDNVIKEQLDSGIVEVVNGEPKPLGTVHYIPHREVIREERETTKLRIVYHASSKAAGEISLNECLESGPNLAPLLFDILLRFRAHNVALISDIQKAFLNITIDPEQRDFLRFFWLKNCNAESPEIITLRFTRLVFGLTCSPYILNATLRHHLNSTMSSDPTFIENVISSIYVDDFASSYSSEEECFGMYQKLKQCFIAGGFNFRKFASNNSEILRKIEAQEKRSNQANLSENEDAISFENREKTPSHVIRDENIKVLGIPWDQNNDKLALNLSFFAHVAAEERVTKRVVISTIARFYDPLGIAAPTCVLLKQLFQEICKIKIGWDDCLPSEISIRFQHIVQEMARVSSIEFDRSLMKGINPNDVKAVEIHGFGDASIIALGACVYIRFLTFDDQVFVRLVAAKTRVAPLKHETMPRLELMAALVLAKLINSVENALRKVIQITKVYCWSDSQVALWWIKNEDKVHKQFIHNRVTTIRNLVNKENWEYCPTNANPADLASRGCSASKLINNELWFCGPAFLRTIQKSLELDKKFSETKRQLKVIKDEQEVYRVSGRLDNAPIPFSTKFPVLLPRRHYFTELVIRKNHLIVEHNGTNETLTQIRTEYWICKGRQTVKTLLSKCVQCKRLMGKCYDTPGPPPLPGFRVSDDVAFSNIAVDFAGPLYVKNIYSDSNETHKCYIALFTCASTRAIHLELAVDLQANSFIRVLKRLIGRRGLPTRVQSDNGKTFVDKMVQRYILSRDITWKFNLPCASWYGGFFEILVKLTKRCLRKTLGNALLAFEELETVLIETEGVLNSRPLTFVSSDIGEAPLTPSCLVIGRRLLDKPSISQDVELSDTKHLTKRLKYLNTLMEHFFARWKQEYLPALREHACLKKGSLKRIAQVGDIVNIHKDKIPRQRWALGKIMRLIIGQDGGVRGAELVTMDSAGRNINIKRPLKKLYPLEVQEVPEVSEAEQDVQITQVKDEDVAQFIKGL